MLAERALQSPYQCQHGSRDPSDRHGTLAANRMQRPPTDGERHMQADTSGCVKIWDIRNYACVQTINLSSSDDLSLESAEALAVMPQTKRIIVGGKGGIATYDGECSFGVSNAIEWLTNGAARFVGRWPVPHSGRYRADDHSPL